MTCHTALIRVVGGTMTSVSAAFAAVTGRAGTIIAVIPGIPASTGDDSVWATTREAAGGGSFIAGPTVPPPGYPNDYAELVIQTHLSTSGASGTALNSRNHINILSSDVVVRFQLSTKLLTIARTSSFLCVMYLHHRPPTGGATGWAGDALGGPAGAGLRPAVRRVPGPGGWDRRAGDPR
jgi:hypothetical protein